MCDAGCNCNSCGVPIPIGPPGQDGAQGPQGPEGPEGPQGIQGDIGPAGANGTNGVTAPPFSNLPFLGRTTPYFNEVVNQIYNFSLVFIYPGSSNHLSPTGIKLVGATGVGGSSVDIEVTIRDLTTSLEWVTTASGTFSTGSLEIIDLGVPININSSETVMSVNVEKLNGPSLTLYSLLIDYA